MSRGCREGVTMVDGTAISGIGITKHYAGVPVLNGVDFKISRGKIHGLLGPNGAGKTTLMRILVGLTEKTAGEIALDGHIGYLPEFSPLYSDMQVGDYLKFMSQIHDVPLKTIEERIPEIISQLSLEDVKDRLIAHLSKGMKQRVSLAAILLFDPPILILDEPTVGMDVNAILEMREVLQSLKGSHTVLLSTHQLHEAELLCDEMTILNNGQVIFSGTQSEAKARFKSVKMIMIQVKGWNQTYSKNFYDNTLSFVEEIKEKNIIDGVMSLRIKLKSDKNEEKNKDDNRDKESRQLLLQELAKLGCEVVSFGEEEMPLEEIFVKIIGEKNNV